jgi:TPR repeat protein
VERIEVGTRFTRVRWLIALAVPALLLAAGCLTDAEQCRHADEEHDMRDRDACQDACDEARDAFGCRQAATAMYLGEYGPKDLEGALRYGRAACAIDPKECHTVRFYECSIDAKLCRERCLAKDPDSCAWLARAHLDTTGRAGYDHDKALAAYRRACELDGRFCMEGFGIACGNNPNTCLVGCENGVAELCYWTSVLFRMGRESILRDRDKAATYLVRACRLAPALPGMEERCARLELPPPQAESDAVTAPPAAAR